jgi:hypothetical protein
VVHRDRPHDTAAGALDATDSDGVVESIEQDFAALVDALERQLKSVPRSDRESRSHILKAKEAAERGVSLSRRLIEQRRSSR